MLMHVVHEVTFSNTTIVMTFSSSLRFRKGVTNFLKICFYSILSSGMTCVGTELVKDTAKILKEIISSSMSGIVCITQHHSIDISLKTIRFGPNRFMSARLEVDSSDVYPHKSEFCPGNLHASAERSYTTVKTH
ncbi:hypothetical protein P8452_19192 [Trifolium repens]|nr:hypothetical protein P8452_19192 [Trifolium repens]